MEFIKYDNIKNFTDDNLKLLLEKEWLNNLIVGNCLDGLKNGADGWTLAKVMSNSKTELIILHRRPWNLLLYSPTNNQTDELYEYAAQEIYKIDNNVNGVNAEKILANKFAKYYSVLANKEAKSNFEMRILLLEQLSQPKLMNDVVFREAKREEENILLEFLRIFQKEALGEELELDTLKERLNGYFEKGYFVLEVNGKIVSQAVIARDLIKGKTISEVFTPKEYRGKGYAYNLMYRISEKMLKEGAEYCVLYTDDKNPISNHVYEKIGYVRQLDTEEIRFI